MTVSETSQQPKQRLPAAMVVGVGTMASRVAGFIRDLFIAALLGTGPFAEIFVIAFRLPNLFRRIFAEGAFNSAFVPLFSEALQTKGQSFALQFATRVFSILITSLIILTILAEIFMPSLIATLAQGFVGSPEKFEQAVHYARISFPYLIFMSVMSLFGAMLNAKGHFIASAFAPLLLNVVLILAMAVAVMASGVAIDYLIWGVAVAGVVQFAFVFVAAWRSGLRLKLTWPRWTPDVKVFFTLLLPGLLASGIAQINLLVGTSIATGQQGAAAWLYYADRLYQLPLGVIGVALSVALLPNLSRHVAANDEASARASQSGAVLVATGLTIPAALGLYILAGPAVEVLFERGAFTADDTLATARALQALCFGLPAFVLIRALQPSFFARKDTRTPLLHGGVGVVVNLTMSISLFPEYGHMAIAYATSAAGWVTLMLMLERLIRHSVWSLDRPVMRQLAGQLAASLIMGMALMAAVHMIAFPSHFTGSLLWVAGMVAGGTAMFILAALGLGGITRAQLRSLRGRV